ncbi:MAG: hypothetical protein QM586_18830 [Xenophilus sp.]
MAVRGALLSLLWALAGAAPVCAAGLNPPERLTLKGVDYVPDPAGVRGSHGPWRYVTEDELESGPWSTEIVLSQRHGPVSTPEAEAARLRAGRGRPSVRLLDAHADPQHAYWGYLEEPPAGEQSSYLAGAGKSFHAARCQGVVHYEFRARYPMAWLPNERQRTALRQELENDVRRFADALKADGWRPSCE